MKKRLTYSAPTQTTIRGRQCEVKVTTDGEELARFQRYDHGSMSPVWTPWRPTEQTLINLAISRGMVDHHATKRAHKFYAGIKEDLIKLGGKEMIYFLAEKVTKLAEKHGAVGGAVILTKSILGTSIKYLEEDTE